MLQFLTTLRSPNRPPKHESHHGTFTFRNEFASNSRSQGCGASGTRHKRTDNAQSLPERLWPARGAQGRWRRRVALRLLQRGRRATRAGVTERRKLQEGNRVADLASVGWLRTSSAMPQGLSEFSKAAAFVGAAALAATELLPEAVAVGGGGDVATEPRLLPTQWPDGCGLPRRCQTPQTPCTTPLRSLKLEADTAG